ncbi:MAG TPA: alpha/beta fold hydrolase [Gemmatimonadaceae bacterium]|nr:alpha/beta fold hydrolase [Gemmatimonadaceae bacterium]
MRKAILAARLGLSCVGLGMAGTSWAQRGPGVAADFTIHDFTFASGETLADLRIHYTTLGQPRRDAGGVVRNAVLVLHGTGGAGTSLIRPYMPLFVPGGLLDTSRFYIIFPDGIGHGGSSKPSDGLHMRFPKYTYDDMVAAQHALLVDGLKVTHLHLIMGTSMGCMHAWIWAERYPPFADGLVPLACAPTEIAGRNRMMRKMIIDDIEQDPAWKGGEYGSVEPREGLRAASGILFLMGSAPLYQQKTAPTRAAADSSILAYLDREVRTLDANDMIYQFDASREYNPSTALDKITAPILAINSADDQINPPELGIVERLVARVRTAKFVLIPISDQTRGHGTHSMPNVWKDVLASFLATLPTY